MAVKSYNAGVKEYRETYWDPQYTPKDTDILACFKVTAQPGVSREEAAAAVTAESSTGTWTTVWMDLLTDLEHYKGRAYHIEDVPGDLDYGSIRILDASDDSVLAVMENQTIDGNTSGWEEYSMALPAAAFTAAAGTIKVEWQFEADDIDSFEILYDVVGLPAGGTFDTDTGRLEWTPTLADGGDWPVTVSATEIRRSATSAVVSTSRVGGSAGMW